MRRPAAWLAVLVYAVLLGAFHADLYAPLEYGRDAWWWLPVLLVCAHLGVALVVRRRAMLVLPALAYAPALGDPGWYVASVVVSVAVLAVGMGLAALAERARESAATVAGAALLVIAVVPFAWAANETLDRAGARVLPAADQRRLPIGLSLANLCPGSATRAADVRMLRAQTERLFVELERRPDWLVDYTYYYSHSDDERARITVRELAEEALTDLEEGSEDGPDCAPDLQRRLRAALD